MKLRHQSLGNTLELQGQCRGGNWEMLIKRCKVSGIQEESVEGLLHSLATIVDNTVLYT